MRLNHILRTTVSAAVVGAAVFGAGAVAAQEQEVTRVDDIIVTAQKREQSLQDVPIVVTTLSEELLEDAGVRDIKDLQILTPGMTVTSTQSEASTTARIRGVGTVGDNPGLESSVGVVIDGVYRSRNSVGFGDLGELSRIEVLKGPQGTLFGKNTSAGVINIITEQPSFTPEWEAEATIGNYDARAVSGSVSGPLTDTLAFRLYAGRRLRDGFYEVNTGDGPRTLRDDANQDFGTVRGQLLWLPNENTSLRLIADYSRRDEYCCVGVQVRTGPTYPFIDATSAGTGQRPPAPGFGFLPFSRQAFANRDTFTDIEDKGVSLEANIDMPSLLGGATLTSITAWRDWSSDVGMDIDYTGADIAYRPQDGGYGYSVENLSQELRLAGSTDRLDWLVGLFATTEDIDRQDSFWFGDDYGPVLSFQLSAALNGANPLIPVSPSIIPCFTRPGQTALQLQQCLGTGGAVFGATGPTAVPPGPTFAAGQSLSDRYSQKSDSIAIFTNNTFRVTDQFDITLGLRFTSDKKELTGLQDNLGANQGVCAAGLANAAAITTVVGAANAPQILGRLCLPWSNPFYDNRTISEDVSDEEISGTIKAAYRLNDSIMAYASYARGYKSFGYNMDRVQTGVTPNASLFFPSEMVDSYEAGVKMTLLDRTLLLNVTYFDQRFEDFQLNTFLGTAFVVESIPELNSKGVDADFLWFTPIEGLSLQGGVTYTDAQYGEFTAADLFNPANFPGLSLLPGSRPSFAPEWSVVGGINFDRSLGGGLRGGFSLNGKWMSEYNTGSDLLPYKMQDDYAVVNGRISLGTEDERWTLELWAQNLTDEEYTQVAYNGFLQGSGFSTVQQPDGSFYNPATDSQTIDAFLGAPRTYGMTLRFRY
ncbi:MAG TPA: TonB-dependent receptor [Brevundimonas sp.]|jgi:outer membrane receptor protein involved in Fe transport|uniref:TonB-dependent receptor n=1 Tax=Brevundimonas sp. TaxID=1871086 RepID=UPI002DE376A5|nr:TonB-dependent receptor [Brevundimonas sp.]